MQFLINYEGSTNGLIMTRLKGCRKRTISNYILLWATLILGSCNSVGISSNNNGLVDKNLSSFFGSKGVVTYLASDQCMSKNIVLSNDDGSGANPTIFSW